MKINSLTLLVFIVLCTFTGSLNADNGHYKLIRIKSENGFKDPGNIPGEIIKISDNYAEIIVNKYEYDILPSLYDSVETIREDLAKYYSGRLTPGKSEAPQSLNGMPPGSMGGYYTLAEIYDMFDEWIGDYPDILSKKIIGNTWEDRPIYSYTLSECSGNNCHELLITALHHAREPMSVMSLMHFVHNFLENYANGNTHAEFLLKNRKFVFVPVVNPDGYFYNQRIAPGGGGMWRKNRRPINDTTWGVDLNRNYGPHNFWDYPNKGSSKDIQSGVYRGPEPFSEPEIRAIRELCVENDFRIALNLHSYGDLFMYPWGVLDRETEDSLLFRAIGRYVNSSTDYVFGLDSETVGYIARGASDDWMYKETDQKRKIFAATPEVGNKKDGFWPPRERIPKLMAKNLRMFYTAAWSAGVNIRPVEYDMDYRKYGSSPLRIKMQNIGAKDFEGIADVNIASLSDSITVYYPERKIYELASAGTQYLEYDFDYIKGFRNGSIIPLEIMLSHNGITRRDTLRVRMLIPHIIEMYDGMRLADEWEAGGWGLQQIGYSQYYLADSPGENYEDAKDNYLKWTDPIDLSGADAAMMEIQSRWMVERTYDFAVAQISTDGGETWEYLEGSRSVEGLGIEKTKQPTGSKGWLGNMKDMIIERIPLDEYIGEEAIFRFGVLSDNSKNFAGWDIRRIDLMLFDIATDVRSSETNDIEIYPNPLISGELLNISLPEVFENAGYEISDFMGDPIAKGTINGLHGEIDLSGFPAGTYYLRISSGGGCRIRKIVILK